jgi:hypothetical protein
MIRKFIKAVLAAFGIGLVFDALYLAAAAALTALFSAAALLDPLNQWARAGVMRAAAAGALILHIAFLISSSATVAAAVLLVDKTRIKNYKTAAAALSFFLHCFLVLTIGGAFFLFYKNDYLFGYLTVYLIFMTAVAPLKGTAAAAAAGKTKQI